MNDTELARDVFSDTLARLKDYPTVVVSRETTITLQTLLRHTETWIVQTIRVNGNDTVFLQRIDANGGMRLVVPPEIVATIGRQGGAVVTKVRKRAARAAVDTKREAGQEIGNAAALAKARKARAK